MKTPKRNLSFPLRSSLLIIALSATANAGEIPISGIEAFHQGDSLDGNGSVLKAIDGSGMDKLDFDDPSTWTVASTAWADDWQGFSSDNSGDNTWAVIDLGAPVASLSTMYLWNVEETNALDRGVKDFEVFHATSPTLLPPTTSGTVTPYGFASGGWTAIGGSELKMGIQIGDAGQAYDLSDAAGARYIGLKLTSNYGGFRTGFAEVAFSDAADPDALTLGEPVPPDPPVDPPVGPIDGNVVPIAKVSAFHQGDSLDANGSVLKIADGSGMAKGDANDPSTWTISNTAWADDWQGFSADNSGNNTWAVLDLGAQTAGTSKRQMLSIAEQALLMSTTPPPPARQRQTQAELSHPMILEAVDGLSLARETILRLEVKLAIPVKFSISRVLRGLGISGSTSPLTMVASVPVSPKLLSQWTPCQEMALRS